MEMHRKQGKCIFIEEPLNHYMCSKKEKKKKKQQKAQKCHKNIKVDCGFFPLTLTTEDNQRSSPPTSIYLPQITKWDLVTILQTMSSHTTEV